MSKSFDSAMGDFRGVDAIGTERATYRALLALLFVWWLAFVLPPLAIDGIEESLTTADAQTQSGSLYNQVLAAAFCGIGGAALLRQRPRTLPAEALALLLLIAAYGAWAMVTVFWSDDPSLSLRRFALLLLLIGGAGGLGACFYGTRPDGLRRLSIHLMVSAVALIAMLATTLLVRGQFAGATEADWSLKLTITTAAYTYYVGFAAIGALYVLRSRPAWQITTFAIFIAILMALKGRGVLLSTLGTGGVFLARTSPWWSGRVAGRILGVTASLAVVDLGTGGHVFSVIAMALAATPLLDYLTLGAGLDNVLDLSGRADLWPVLLEHVSRRPFGYGFGAFWTPDRLSQVQMQTGWPAVNAHNGPLDELLATGLIGSGLALLLWVYALWLSIRLTRVPALRASAILVGAWLQLMLLFNMTDSTMQFFFQMPPLLTLTAVSALLAQWAGQQDHTAAGIGLEAVVR